MEEEVIIRYGGAEWNGAAYNESLGPCRMGRRSGTCRMVGDDDICVCRIGNMSVRDTSLTCASTTGQFVKLHFYVLSATGQFVKLHLRVLQLQVS